MPPLKRTKRLPSSEAKRPRKLTAAIKRKTTSSAKLARPGTVLGIFSRPQNQPDASEHTKHLPRELSEGDELASQPQPRSFLKMFNGLSLKRHGDNQDQFMSGGKTSPANNPFLFVEQGQGTQQSPNKRQSFLRSARSRMSLKHREEPTPVLLGRVSRQKTFQGPMAIHRERAVASSFHELDPCCHTENSRGRVSGRHECHIQPQTVLDNNNDTFEPQRERKSSRIRCVFSA